MNIAYKKGNGELKRLKKLSEDLKETKISGEEKEEQEKIILKLRKEIKELNEKLHEALAALKLTEQKLKYFTE